MRLAKTNHYDGEAGWFTQIERFKKKLKKETDPLKEELKTNRKLLQELEVYIQDNKKI